jgi:hypothetical protein
MKKLIDWGMEKARKFTVLDFAFFKITLFSLGLIIGIYFATSLKEYLPLFWIIFAFTYVYLIYRMFKK